jgi:hypothetical protein
VADVTADGKYVVTGFSQDLSDRFPVDLAHGYIGFHEIWAAKPHSTIWKIPLEGGEPQRVYDAVPSNAGCTSSDPPSWPRLLRPPKLLAETRLPAARPATASARACP